MVDPARMSQKEKAQMVMYQLVNTPTQTFETSKKSDHGAAESRAVKIVGAMLAANSERETLQVT